MNRNKIYIIVIIICVVATAGIIYWGSSGGEVPEVDPSLIPLDDTALQETPTESVSPISPNTNTQFPSPQVFPSTSKYDMDTFTSSDFSALKDYVPLTVTDEEMGRENPFQSN